MAVRWETHPKEEREHVPDSLKFDMARVQLTDIIYGSLAKQGY